MEKKTLSNILEGKIFEIPDYQRGYAWNEKQWSDFIQDIDALIDDNVVSHYTGTIVLYQKPNKPTENYGIKKLELVDVVDGQQRLTTCSLYLSIIIKELIAVGNTAYEAELTTYLYSGSKSKLKLNNDTSDFYFDLITKGSPNITANSLHQERLLDTYNFLKAHIVTELKKRGSAGESYLSELYDAVTRKLNFSFYTIEVESEIGMTFELMNSRGKGLSSMELLKNYFMHWVYRNVTLESEKDDYTQLINKTWKEVYINIARSGGNEDQCLHIAWTLLIDSVPKNWSGYRGFKSDKVFPLRNFTNKTKEEVKVSLHKFTESLASISKHYSVVLRPDLITIGKEEYQLLTRIKQTGNIANFLPLLIAGRVKFEEDNENSTDYLRFLKAIETFSYRVFLWEGKRSNSGISKFYRWSDDLYSGKWKVKNVVDWIYGAINAYSPEVGFRDSLKNHFFEWYKWKRLLKYTMFEYELFLLGGKAEPELKWSELSDSTIEHIFPQSPNKESQWLKDWNEEDRTHYLHDISNLVLTKDNSSYQNFDFERKRNGLNKDSVCYRDSNIKQERAIAKYDVWTVQSCQDRREMIIKWIIETWGIDHHLPTTDIEIVEEEDVDIELETEV